MVSTGLMQMCFVAVIILVINLDGASCSTNVCTKNVNVPYTYSCDNYDAEPYTVRCGVWGWGRCPRCRMVSGTPTRRTVSIRHPVQSCCSGWENMRNGRCTTPICNPCCENGGTCISKDTCSCPPNFSGPTCSNDVNECLTNNGRCAHECINSVGSYNCVCRPGYQLASNGRTCNDINECGESNGGCDHICQNTVGSFTCRCRGGFTLGEDGKTCNANYCDETDCEQNCFSVSGRGVCYCDPGYYLAADGKSCIDINECSSNDTNVCEYSCENTLGSYNCSCEAGYTIGDDEHTCVDVDECLAENGGCDHNCVNTNGSYYCTCNEYFKLADDKKTCYQ